ncbi:MAG: hypothetical protein LBI66_11125, partial [Burkholderiaceae bacterium]|nr:hypothetical protein [Burkholderiaceae bacterium]
GYAREAAETYRQLANSQPAAYQLGLAMSLNNLANRLSEQGDAESRAEALGCAREAVDIYTALPEKQRTLFLRKLDIAKKTLARIAGQPQI